MFIASRSLSHGTCKNPTNFRFHLFFFRSPGGINVLSFKGAVMELGSQSMQMDIHASHLYGLTPITSTCNLRSSNDYITTNIDELTSSFILVVNASKKRKPKWQVLGNFQYIWVAKFQWAKLVVRVHGKLHYVRCKICTNVENKEKMLVPKLGVLYKHNGRRKCKCVKHG